MEAHGRVLRHAYNGILIPLRGAFAAYAAAGRMRGLASREFEERLGRFVGPPKGALWIQASSVGEVGVAARLIGEIASPRPRLPILLTTTTRTGQALARRSIGDRARLAYFPLDFRASVRRALAGILPAALLLVETEIWPNLILEASRRDVAVLIANGRISDWALSRYRLIAPLVRQVLGEVKLACVQSTLDGERFESLGVPHERIRVTGNIKFASSPAAAERTSDGGPESWLQTLGLDPRDEVWVGGSTADGEEEAVLGAFEGLPRPLSGRRILVLAPRRPERFDQVASLLAARGRPWRRWSERPMRDRATRARISPGTEVLARSVDGRGGEAEGSSEIVLLDTIGELPSIYASATAAFVGGSLVPVGGQNLIEPASCGVAPVFGPHVENFRHVASRLLEAGGAFQVQNARDLADLFRQLAADPERRRRAGESARRVVTEGSESLARTLGELLPYLPCEARETA